MEWYGLDKSGNRVASAFAADKEKARRYFATSLGISDVVSALEWPEILRERSIAARRRRDTEYEPKVRIVRR